MDVGLLQDHRVFPHPTDQDADATQAGVPLATDTRSTGTPGRASATRVRLLAPVHLGPHEDADAAGVPVCVRVVSVRSSHAIFTPTHNQETVRSEDLPAYPLSVVVLQASTGAVIEVLEQELAAPDVEVGPEGSKPDGDHPSAEAR
jgi:hypothetical protein